MAKLKDDNSPKSRAADARELEKLRKRAAGCQACDLWRNATQTVFGAGPVAAELMLVGEQPGDQEDQAGQPFVGAAGRVLNQALERAGIDVSKVYITNAVKHFKWTARGKRRIHERPNREEILACRMWLEGEIAHVRPRAIVALGATAAGVLAGPHVRVTRDRGRLIESPHALMLTVTVHPSSILRAPSDEDRREAMERFVADLKAIARRLQKARA
jgi:uracil-DNA glycosylase family protein